MARLRAPLESPEMAGLAHALDDVNWLADKSPGFVWRHRPDEGPLTYTELDGTGRVVLTLSVWDDDEALQRFVFRTAHALFMGRRAKWFTPTPGLTTVLWWVPAGHQPSVSEALERLEHLRDNGPTPFAFSFRRQFEPDGSQSRS